MKATLNRSKRLLAIEQAPPRHWVGDGFPVRSMFSYDSAPSLSPFVMNTEREIRQAIEDYRHGRMGHLD